MKNTIHWQNQQGFTLIMSMIFLVVLTIVGLTSIQNTRVEIAMAGNLRESDMAFQVAEIGLSSGEKFIMDSISKSDYDKPAEGLYPALDNDPNYFEPLTWEASQTSSADIPSVYKAPLFIIKYLGDRAQNEVASVNIGGYGTAQPGLTISNFRVTAKGGGQTDSAERILQSYFGKEF